MGRMVIVVTKGKTEMQDGPGPSIMSLPVPEKVNYNNKSSDFLSIPGGAKVLQGKWVKIEPHLGGFLLSDRH